MVRKTDISMNKVSKAMKYNFFFWVIRCAELANIITHSLCANYCRSGMHVGRQVPLELSKKLLIGIQEEEKHKRRGGLVEPK